MAIWPKDREEITAEEFLDACAKYDIDCRRAGDKVWIYTPVSTRSRMGSKITPGEVVEFVLHELVYEGLPCLRFIRSKRDPSIVALAWTDAGKLSKFYHRKWGEHNRRTLARGVASTR